MHPQSPRPRFRSVDVGTSEHAEQARVIAQRDAKIAAGNEEFRLLFAVQNWAGVKNGREGARRKAEGVSPGAPDLVFALPRTMKSGRHYCGLWVEMKRIRRKTTKTKGLYARPTQCTPEQEEIQALLRSAGHLVVVCYDGDEAWSLILRYWRGEVNPPQSTE